MPDLFQALPANVREKYARAVEAEAFRRSAAMLELPEEVCGFFILPLTLRRYIILRAANSPLLDRDAIPTQAELAAFLWLSNPDYHPTRGKKMFLRKVRQSLIPPTVPLIRAKRFMRRHAAKTAQTLLKAALVIQKCCEVVFDAFDEASAGKSQPTAKHYYCDAVAIIGTMAREYGWTRAEILDMPLAQTLQFCKEIRRYHNPEVKLFNESDKILSDWVASVNREAQK